MVFDLQAFAEVANGEALMRPKRLQREERFILLGRQVRFGSPEPCLLKRRNFRIA